MKKVNSIARQTIKGHIIIRNLRAVTHFLLCATYSMWLKLRKSRTSHFCGFLNNFCGLPDNLRVCAFVFYNPSQFLLFCQKRNLITMIRNFSRWKRKSTAVYKPCETRSPLEIENKKSLFPFGSVTTFFFSDHLQILGNFPDFAAEPLIWPPRLIRICGMHVYMTYYPCVCAWYYCFCPDAFLKISHHSYISCW